MESSQRGLRAERGQALVEIALIVPLFLFLLFGMIDFGRAYSASITLTNAVREGARYGITKPTDSAGIATQVQTTAGPYNDANLTISSSCTPSCSSGNSVVVNTSYSFSFITPVSSIANLISGGSLPTKLTLTSSATMRIE